MGLKTLSLLSGATISASGGTALVFATNGKTIADGLQLVIPADADYQTRRMLTAKVKQPSINPKTGAYGKDKKSLCLAKPKVLPTGEVIYETIRCEREMHPSSSAAECAEMNKLGAQLFSDSDLDAYWANGSMD